MRLPEERVRKKDGSPTRGLGSVLLRSFLVVVPLLCALFGLGSARTSQASPATWHADKLVSYFSRGGCPKKADYDENGVIRVTYGKNIGVQYNPVTISQFALSCFSAYKFRNVEWAKDIYLSQINFLKEKWTEMADGEAAYIYDFEAGFGMKPGWTSGMAQGLAISALIRHHYDTGDTSVIQLIQSLKRHMMRPKAEGGVVVKSPEGGLWIEEYPSDPSSYVLNGYIYSVFALYEYSKLFPDDEAAKTDLRNALDSLKQSIRYYDTGDWTILDRFPGLHGGANDDYMITHLHQASTLWEITQDAFFRRVAMRWHSFMYDVHFRSPGALADSGDGKLTASAALQALVPAPNALTGNIAKSTSVPLATGYGLDKLLDSNFKTYMAPSQQGDGLIEITLKEPRRANAIALGLYNTKLYPEKFTLEIKGPEDKEFKVVDTKVGISRRYITLYFEEVDIAAFRLTTTAHKGQNRLVLAELSLGMTKAPAVQQERYSTYLSEPVELGVSTFRILIDAPGAGPQDLAIMYRYADRREDIDKAPWAWGFIEPNAAVSARGKIKQFRLLASREQVGRGLSGFEIDYGNGDKQRLH